MRKSNDLQLCQAAHIQPRATRLNLLRLHAILLGFGCTLANSPSAYALPTGGNVVSGQAAITQTTSTMNVSQVSNRLMLDWRSFGIKPGEQVIFNQPSASAVAVNRVTGKEFSDIGGVWRSNGHMVLINPNGIVFQESARIDLGSLVATSHWLSKEDFEAGRMSFSSANDSGEGKVTNKGVINVTQGGSVILSAPQVENSGTIQAHLGQVALVASDALSVHFDGNNRLGYTVPTSTRMGKALQAINNGTLQANGGTVLMSADAKEAVMNSVVSMGGRIEAQAVSVRNGRVILHSGAGKSELSGSVDVSGVGSGEKGGSVEITGANVQLGATARVNAAGDAGGGTVKIGGDRQGANPAVRNATHTVVEKGASINADAVQNGNGGEVIVWSDNATDFRGAVSVRGGRQSGDGGFVELSGKDKLRFKGQVDASAPKGKWGTLLLDPANIYIDILDWAPDTTITPSDLSSVTSNVSLEATNEIHFNTSFTLPNAVSLTASAGNNIYIRDKIILDDNLHFTSTSGNILFSDNGSIHVGNHAVTLLASNGMIDVANTTNPHITAASLTMTSKTGIGNSTSSTPIYTAVNSLSFANSGSGDVRISNIQALIVNDSSYTGSGSIEIASNNDLSIDSITASNSSVKLVAGDSIKGNALSSGLSYHLAANSADLQAGSGIGTDAALLTQLNSLSFNSTGNVDIRNSSATPGELAIGLSQYSNASTISLEQTNGNIKINSIKATDGSSATVTLTANAGQILRDGSCTADCLVADTLILKAANNIGSSSQELFTKVNNLDFTTTAGNVWIKNSGTVNIKGSYSGASSLSLQTVSGDAGDPGHMIIQSITSADQANLGNITLTAAGTLSGDQNSLTHIEANSATLTAGSGIGSSDTPLQTVLGTLRFTNDQGDVWINNAGNLSVGGTQNGSGNSINLAVSSAFSGATPGNLLVTSIAATNNFVNLQTAGTLSGDPASISHIDANSATLTAGNGMGTTATHLKTSVSTLAFNNDQNDVAITNSGSVLLSQGKISGSGNVSLQVNSGDLSINTIEVNDTITLNVAQGSMTGNGAQTHLKANSAVLTAQSGIGTAGQELTTSLSFLDFTNTSNGVVNISNTNPGTAPLTLSGKHQGTGAGNTVTIATQSGDLLLNDMLASTSAVTLQAVDGNLLGVANQTHVISNTLDLQAPVGSIGEENNNIITNISQLAFSSGQDLYLTNSGNLKLSTGRAGNIVKLAATSINGHAASNMLQAPFIYLTTTSGIGNSTTLNTETGNLTFSNDNGNVSIINSGEFTVNATQGGTGNSISLRTTNDAGNIIIDKIAAPSNSVSITVNNGSLLGLEGNIHIDANSATLTAINGMGAVDNPLQTLVNDLTLTNSNGEIFLNNQKAMKVTASNGGVGQIVISTSVGDLTVESIAGGGLTTLTSEQGSLLAGTGAGPYLTSDSAILRAESGIGTVGGGERAFISKINTLTASVNSGSINIQNNQDLALESVTASADIKLKISGALTSNNISITNITAANAILEAGGIGTGTGLRTDVSSLVFTNNSNGVTLTNADSVKIQGTQNGTGPVTITNNNGTLKVGSITSQGVVSLMAELGDILFDSDGAIVASSAIAANSVVSLFAPDGSIDSTIGGPTAITANSADLNAMTGIGTATRYLPTSVSKLLFSEAYNNGKFLISNNGKELTIGSISINSVLDIKQDSNLIIDGPLTVGGLTINVTGGTLQINSAGIISSTGTNESGKIDLQASGDIISHANRITTNGASVYLRSPFNYENPPPDDTSRYTCFIGHGCLNSGKVSEKQEFAIITNGGDIEFNKISANNTNSGGVFDKLEIYLLAGVPNGTVDANASYDAVYTKINGGRLFGELDFWNTYLSAASGTLTGNSMKAVKIFRSPSNAKVAADIIYAFPSPHNGLITFNGYPVGGSGRSSTEPGPYYNLLARTSKDFIPEKTSTSDWVLDTSENPVLYNAMKNIAKITINDNKNSTTSDGAQGNSSKDSLSKCTGSNCNFVYAVGVNYGGSDTGSGSDAGGGSDIVRLWSDLGPLNNNAKLIEKQLTSMSFQSVTAPNQAASANRDSILGALKQFAKEKQGEEGIKLLVYFTGHGLLFENRGYWVSQDAAINKCTSSNDCKTSEKKADSSKVKKTDSGTETGLDNRLFHSDQTIRNDSIFPESFQTNVHPDNRDRLVGGRNDDQGPETQTTKKGEEEHLIVLKNLISKEDIVGALGEFIKNNMVIIITDACTPGDLASILKRSNSDESMKTGIYSVSASLPFLQIDEKNSFRNQTKFATTPFSEKLVSVLQQREKEATQFSADQFTDEIVDLVQAGINGWQDWSKRSHRVSDHKPLFGKWKLVDDK
ncbi:filamentous hemagglutinin N-terminal domain-containing protein [Candidatus Magnetaquicoccus inordinatus]|uniref:two-partner secretion domain-containing protein n=1 Tax=Candidatus Magnetaquicoccus inordinatus TaxID=2496818 RepID=UPI00102C0398|nr:filamentous hemagglutinin N-terminal domain-containing protein [Candidatus Magnetaquicoccus inordinatus]